MINRIVTVVAAATLLSLSGGCAGMKNFLFGRGARCGACTGLANIRPQFGNTMQVPYSAPTCQTPQYQPPVFQRGAAIAPQAPCGCNGYAGNNYAGPVYDNQAYADNSCNTCYGSTPSHAPQIMGDCGCVATDSYGPTSVDPYLNSGQTYNEQIIGGPVMGEQIIGNPVYGEQIIGEQVIGGSQGFPSTPIQSDDFQARKIDTDGNRILWEEPLPPGTTPQ